MVSSQIELLRFRRQYLFLPFETDCPFLYKKYRVHNYFLYTHIDLKVTVKESNDYILVLLGDLFDYLNTTYNNEQILNELIHHSADVLPEKLSQYCGRFVLISAYRDQIRMINDAATSRKVFYYQNEAGLCCASQPHLLARVLNLSLSTDPEKIAFYSSSEFKRLNNANIGNTTCYDGMYQLRANHYLDVNRNCQVRYWPNKKIVIRPLSEIASESVEMLQGYMNAIANRYEMMLPVTAGKDSRLLLATTKNMPNRVFYYINRHSGLNKKSYDIAVPSKLLPSLGLEYHVLEAKGEVNKDFRQIYYENNPYASDIFLPFIYNYHLHFPEKVNLPGIFVNAAEEIWETSGKQLTPEYLAELIHIENYKYAVDYLKEWFESCRELCASYSVDPLYLLYWEERIGNWGTQVQLDKDIAQEDIIPFNSRNLIETMMSVQVCEREKPDFLLNLEMIRRIWPETLQQPINPYFKQNFLIVSKNLGVMKITKAIYYSTLYYLLEKLKLLRNNKIL
jgi:hypothetical protein